MAQPEKKEHWCVDKRIPLALILTIGVQAGTSIWYASKIDSRVSQLEVWRDERSKDSELLVRMDERLKILTEKVSRIDERLDPVRKR